MWDRETDTELEPAVEDGPDLEEAKDTFRDIWLGLTMLLACSDAAALVLDRVSGWIWPGEQPTWVFWLITFVSMYVVGMPAGSAIMGWAPGYPPERRRLGARGFWKALCISIFLMYAWEFIGSILLSLLEQYGEVVAEDTIQYLPLEGAPLGRFVCTVIAGPCFEEFVFRKLLIDRVRPYGEKLAVVLSAVIFGTIHGNLPQIFYAIPLGALFAYLYVRTGDIRITMSLHMLLNLLGGEVMVALQNRIDPVALMTMSDAEALRVMLPILIYLAVMALVGVVGLVLAIRSLRHVHFERTGQELPKGTRLKTIFCDWRFAAFLALVVMATLETLSWPG